MESRRKPLKVLLASSSTTVLPSFQFIIKKTFKHNVITVSEPEEIINQVEKNKNDEPFDLLITGTFRQSTLDFIGIVDRVRQIDPYVLCALYTNDISASLLAESRGLKLDDYILKKNGPHADLKPLFDRLEGAK